MQFSLFSCNVAQIKLNTSFSICIFFIFLALHQLNCKTEEVDQVFKICSNCSMESRCPGLRSFETGLIYGRFSVTVGKQKQKQKRIQIQGVFLHTCKFNGQPRCMGPISFMVCRCAYLGCIYQYSGMMYFLLRKRTTFQHISMPHIRHTVYTHTSTVECKIRSKNFISLFRDPLAEPKGNH